VVDPDECLAMIRSLVNEMQDLTYNDSRPAELVEAVSGLDEWITSGGFLPEVWTGARRLGRRRHTQDGPILEGVVHGKRRSYNQGCRCIPCTTANRIGADIETGA